MNIWASHADSPSSSTRLAGLSDALFALAEEVDSVGEFPARSIELLRQAGIVGASGAAWSDGAGSPRAAEVDGLFRALRAVGAGDLSVGRLFEGHVNAVQLVRRFGGSEQVGTLDHAIARHNALSAVWNAEGAEPLRFVPDHEGWIVKGCKILSSGAGSITRPLVTGLIDDQSWMAVLRLDARHVGDLSRWTPQGMRSSATGTIDLTGVHVTRDDLIGHPGDYKRQPGFSGGAWRFCAVQLGAIDRLVDLFRIGLVERRRDRDPHQLARVAACAAAAETAALWIRKAACMVDGEDLPSEAIVAYAGLTRMVTERAGLDVMEHVHRGIGLSSFMRPDPIERVARDLATYLRQPAPDGAMADAAATVLASPLPSRALWGDDDRR